MCKDLKPGEKVALCKILKVGLSRTFEQGETAKDEAGGNPVLRCLISHGEDWRFPLKCKAYQLKLLGRGPKWSL